MTDQIICEFCSVVYKNEINLKLHLIRSKKCLKKRGLSLESKNNCKECGKTFVALSNLEVHQESCEKEIDQYKKEHEKERDQEHEKEIDQRKKENDKCAK